MQTSKLNVVILAAGKGTRMVSSLPKVLHQVAGSSLLSHVIACAEQLLADNIMVVYGYGGETVRQAIPQDNITWVSQAEQLGTGHAVQQAMPHLSADGVCLILLGDVPLITADTCRSLLRKAEQGLALLTVEKPDPTGYGRILRGFDGHVQAIVEEKDATPEQRAVREVNSGIMAMPIQLLKDWLGRLDNRNAQGEFYLTDIVGMAVQQGVKVQSELAEDEWEVAGINSKLDLAAVERVYQRSHARRLMQAGVTLRDPERLDVRGELTTGHDVEIDVGCVFEGKVQLGDNVSIGPYCVIKDAVLATGSVIAAYSHIDSAQVGENSRIGPYARLRPGTELMADTHIGNFVEIKNSQVGQGSKINHLSYVGDSTVGKQVNIGAGTITCNYDGVNKYRTVIGDCAFIGSDTQLVAPVTVEAGATIGAGSTITRDAPADTLTLSRSKQITVAGWRRPQKKAK
ncbi:MAG TPA: bifunctional UDP-N-acetylglucosamine diphosphorylase/glucosamine-1-phosphate N-acetyltransferase GlmU [Methylophilaceae bacterium]|nr:bifunctional UDP-N-acetylglucosamine diphosphorylase/glucosamine-1-phosphate N-acetyltransferase GlmU [Methylophilaceae bacterium]